MLLDILVVWSPHHILIWQAPKIFKIDLVVMPVKILDAEYSYYLRLLILCIIINRVLYLCRIINILKNSDSD